MYQKILLPTDGSDAAQPATEHALELAEAMGATVYVVYVVDSSAAAAVPQAQATTINDLLEGVGTQALEDVADLAAEAGVEVVTDVRYGSTHKEILAAAEAVDADLIVMGTHGRAGLDRVLLGSVTERVIRGTDRPVLVERAGESAQQE